MSASPVYILVEGESDKQLLSRLLPKETLRKIKFIVGNGKSSAVSDARTILATKRKPVALVVDTDTTEKSDVSIEKNRIRQLLGNAATDVPYEVFFAFPDLESFITKAPQKNELLEGISAFMEKGTRWAELPLNKG